MEIMAVEKKIKLCPLEANFLMEDYVQNQVVNYIA